MIIELRNFEGKSKPFNSGISSTLQRLRKSGMLALTNRTKVSNKASRTPKNAGSIRRENVWDLEWNSSKRRWTPEI
ncbi:hypothetical protein PGTUg99_005339 [Puccinia graminis f. sp. tritici]|uniref:Uncharacterized protein n=1 Tax=Puccinia graminis f. sp. tritici TaxID=56615 RepID=A0A5B0S2N2_PUCGR|nr:hypothetical protein PGTUg99_005339 [Puccinia graminis f. sp. tritici]